MNLVHYNPHRRANLRTSNVSNPFANFFDDFFAPIAHKDACTRVRSEQHLKVDIYEKNDSVYIDAELPGVEKENISVDVKGKLLTLAGERVTDEEVKEEQSYRRERQYGKFTRSFSLPFEVTDDKVKATFKNGLLKLEIEKPTEQVTKKIDIN